MRSNRLKMPFLSVFSSRMRATAHEIFHFIESVTWSVLAFSKQTVFLQIIVFFSKKYVRACVCDFFFVPLHANLCVVTSRHAHKRNFNRNYNNQKSNRIMANDKQSGLMFNALTAGSKIVGNITADSDFRIDGLIEGELNCSGKVVVGEAGRVKGTISCQNAEIMGLVEGKINCSQQLSLRANCKINGDVLTKTLIVEPGALFNGTCSMGAKAPEPVKK